MVATLISVCMVLALSLGEHLAPGLETMLVIPNDYFELFFGLSLFFSLLPWLSMLFLAQGAEAQPLTMAALRSNLDDWKMYAYSAGIVLFSLIGMLISFQSLFLEIWSFSGMVICVGIILDLFRMTYCRFQYRRTPEGLGEWFIEVMRKSVKRRDEKWYTISFEIPFALMVVYMKCGAYGSLRLFCNRFYEIADLWLGSMARIEMFRVPGESEESVLDRYTHAELMSSKRICWMLQEARNLGSFAAVEETTRLAGKLFLNFHNHHESLGYFLLQTLSQASLRDSGKIALIDLDTEVIATFSSVITSLIEQSVARNTTETSTILMVVSMLENKVKEILFREKVVIPALVIQPISEVIHVLEADRYQLCPGHDEVLAHLQGIVAQFSL